MHPWRTPRNHLVSGLSAILLLLPASGCETSPVPLSNNARPIADGSAMPPVRSPVPEDPYENNTFDQAQPATLPVSGEIVIEGTIEYKQDVDIYALGPAIVGDRIIIDVTGHDGLNTVAALFDGAENLIDGNDDRSYYGGLTDPLISQIVQADTPQLYVGIAVSTARYFGSSQGRYDSGSYSIRVRREPDAAVRAARGQIVYLDFEGGASVQIALEPVVVMRPFSAESISGRFAGLTNYIVDLVVANMRRDLAAFDVTLLDSKHHARPSQPHTELYFGNLNSAYLGLADNVDTGNLSLQQEAIIFSETLSLWEALQPSPEEIGLALANIGSHELGHLLGLEHAAHQGDLMSTAGSARQVLEVDAAYLRSPLQSDVFPVGFQDGVATLLQNLGANPFNPSGRLRLEDTLPQPSGSWRDEAGIADIPIMQEM